MCMCTTLAVIVDRHHQPDLALYSAQGYLIPSLVAIGLKLWFCRTNTWADRHTDRRTDIKLSFIYQIDATIEIVRQVKASWMLTCHCPSLLNKVHLKAS